MRKIKLWFLAAIIAAGGLGVFAASCSGSAGSEQRQILEVYDVSGSSATARLTIDGSVVFTTDVYIGRNGIGKTSEGDGKTPADTLGVLSTFGIKPNPGTKLPYLNVTHSTFACDEQGEYYNRIIDTAAVHHSCRGEDMAHMAPDYNYGIVTDYNRECVWSKGSNIFIHCKGSKPSTAGCIALDEERMVELLQRCDTSLMIVVRN